MSTLIIQPIDTHHTSDLVNLLNYDVQLIEGLGSSSKPILEDAFEMYNQSWAKKHQAQMYAIVLNIRAIGMISLSHIDLEHGRARIGYWVGSSYWGNGYTTVAFEQLLAEARKLGIRQVSCSVPKQNKASLGIWQTFGAKVREEKERFVPELQL